MDGILTIYNLCEIAEIDGLEDKIDELYTLSETKVEKRCYPAALGKLAGEAIEILVSDPAQALTTVVEVGNIIYSIIKLLKKAGKKLRVDKRLAKLLALTKLTNERQLETEQISNIENSVVWGPMAIEPLQGFLVNEAMKYGYDATGETAYMIAIATPKKPRRIRTIWQIISIDGTVLTSWATQTLEERVPDFFLRK